MKKQLFLIITAMMPISGCEVISAMLTNNAEVRYSPSTSMEPTIHGSTDIAKADRLIIDKNAYQKQHPQREDIVMFAATKELQKQGYSEKFVFRIVGLPGDLVEIKAGKLYINNQPDSPKYLNIKQTTTIDVCESGPFSTNK
jgi:signal peptidase I